MSTLSVPACFLPRSWLLILIILPRSLLPILLFRLRRSLLQILPNFLRSLLPMPPSIPRNLMRQFTLLRRSLLLLLRSLPLQINILRRSFMLIFIFHLHSLLLLLWSLLTAPLLGPLLLLQIIVLAGRHLTLHRRRKGGMRNLLSLHH